MAQVIVDENQLCLEVARVLDKASLLNKTRPLLVAVSGGPDSLTLLYLLHKLSTQFPLSIQVAHLNHGLRGVAADQDADYVEKVAKDLNVPIIIETADVRAFRDKYKLSWEEAAREVRYSFLFKAAQRVNASAIALGHTEDDQAETVLLHLLRGTGLQGLRGMLEHSPTNKLPEHKGPTLIRPILKLTRQQTITYCQTKGITPQDDFSNNQMEYTRNKIRHLLIPSLTQYNPSIKEVLVRLAKTTSRDLDFIDQELLKKWGDLVTLKPCGLSIHRDAFLNLHISLQAHLLRRAWEFLCGRASGLTSTHIENMLALAKKDRGSGRALSLGREIQFRTGYEELLVVHEPSVTPTHGLEPLPLSLPGEAQVGRWHVSAHIVDRQVKIHRGGPYQAHLDFESLGKEVQIRSRKSGDRFQPLGMGGTKKLKEFMIDAHIPKGCRRDIPLLTGRDGVAWVVGWRIAHWARVTPKTEQVIEVNFHRIL